MLTAHFSSCRFFKFVVVVFIKGKRKDLKTSIEMIVFALSPGSFEGDRCVCNICNSNMVAFQATKLYFSLSSKVLICFIAHARPAKLAVRGSETSSRFWASLLLSLLAEDIAYNSLVVLSVSPACFGSVGLSISTAYRIPPAHTIEIILADEMPWRLQYWKIMQARHNRM